MVVLLDVDDVGTRRRVAPVTSGLGIREGYLTKIGKRNETSILREIFDDPLSILLAERGSRVETLGHPLAIRQILDRGGP